MTKVKTFKTGSWTVFDGPVAPYGCWLVKLYGRDGNLKDKVMCDDYRNARDYLRSFNAIAKVAP